MKFFKRIIVLFILIWVVVFAFMWAKTILKKPSVLEKKAQPSKVLGKKAKKEVPEKIAEAPEREAVMVRVFKVSPTDFTDELPVMGTVKGALEIDLKFETNGVIESINFREGDIVSKGDLIATLVQKDAQLKKDYAESKLKQAQTQSLAAEKKLQIHKDLYEIGAIIKAKLEEVELEAEAAKQQVETAKVELESAESEFEKTYLYAPRDGLMGSRDAEIGEFVTPQNRVATLLDTKEVFVELGIVEKDIDKIALGQDVKVTVDTYPNQAFSGSIDNVFPLIEGKSRTLTVRTRLQNEEGMLLPGMFARALIKVAEFKDAIVIPSLALNKTDEGYKVFVVDEGNAVHQKDVQVAYITTDYTVIASGLFEGELVVTDTPTELKEGMPVKIIETQESTLKK